VAVEAAADLVVDAAARHPVAGEQNRVEELRPASRTMATEEELERRAVRKLRRAAEATVGAVDVRHERVGGTRGDRRIQLGGVATAGRRAVGAGQPLDDLTDGARDVVRTLAVSPHDGLENPREARQPVPVDG